MLKQLAMIVAACAGIAAGLAYGYFFGHDLDPNLPENAADVPWSPENRRILEIIIVFWSVACASGRLVYLLFGARRDAATVKKQLGGYALILQIVGAFLLLLFLAISIAAGRPIMQNDLLTIAVAFGLLIWAFLDWFWSQTHDVFYESSRWHDV